MMIPSWLRIGGTGLALLLLAMHLDSCKDNLIGKNIMPPGDNINGIYTDTVTLEASTVREDSLKTSTNLDYLVGSINDPVFGKREAGLFAQLSLPSNNIDIGRPDTLSLDSLVLSLDYTGFYGDESQPMRVQVFQVDTNMDVASDYYSNRFLRVDPIAIGSGYFIPDLRQSKIIDGETLTPHMRIRLSDRIGQWFLNQSQQPTFINDVNFQNVFKGVFVVGDTTQGYGKGIAYLDLSAIASRLNLYYHSAHKASEQIHFPFSTTSAKSNYFHSTYGNTAVGDSLLSHHLSGDVTYVSCMGGVKTKISLPYIRNLGHVLINKAELEVTQILDPSLQSGKDDTLSPYPSNMIVARADTNGRNLITPDQLHGHLAFGGVGTVETNAAGQSIIRYRISLAEEVQNLVNDATDPAELNLIIYRAGELADRVIIGSPHRADDYRMKLNVIYTKIQ